MRKSNQQEKKKKIEKSLADHELITIFLANKFKEGARSPYLKMTRNRKGGLVLLCRQSLTEEDYKPVAEHGRIESQVTGRRDILVIRPEFANSNIIKLIFGGFPTDKIYWWKGLAPLTADRAMSIYTEASSPLLRMEV